MKNKEPKTKLAALGVAGHLFSRILYLGAVTLICSSVWAENLFVSANDGSGNIYEFTPTGVRSTFASGLTGPQGLAFDSAGNLFVADDGDAIYKFTPDGVRTTFALGLSYPYMLAFDSEDNLFVTASGAIYKFTPDGVRTTFASGLFFPRGVAFDGAGNLFATDGADPDHHGRGRVYKFTSGGVRSTFASGLERPFGLAFDSAGNLFLEDAGNIEGDGSAIYKFTPGGSQSTFVSADTFCIGYGLAIDSANNLFVPDPCFDRIYKIASSGVRTIFAFAPEGYIGIAFQPAQTTTPTLVNISTRGSVEPGDNVLISGFIINGTDNKTVLLRGIGPSLFNVGVPNPLADPVLELHGPSGFTTITNNNWTDAPNHAQIQGLGLAPSDNLESAILATLSPGTYTAILRDNNNGTGIGLAEVYDADQTTGSMLGNISTRGVIQPGNNVMIGGFILGPGHNSNIAIRGLGPSLSSFGIPNPLTDPTLELRNGNGTLIASNDNCAGSSLPPPDPLESCIEMSLSPAAYTAILAGNNGATGVGLVEIYNLQ